MVRARPRRRPHHTLRLRRPARPRRSSAARRDRRGNLLVSAPSRTTRSRCCFSRRTSTTETPSQLPSGKSRGGSAARSVHPHLRRGGRCSAQPSSVFQAARQRFDPRSPGESRRHRGGALEPGARNCTVNAQAKAAVVETASITAPQRARSFLSQAGPRFGSRASSS